MIRSTFLLLLLGCLSIVSTPGHAVITMNATESGGNVTVTASGSANTAGLTAYGTSSGAGVRSDSSVYIVVGTTATFRTYNSISGPASFGTNSSFVLANTNSGDATGVYGNTLVLPFTYTSGASLSGSATFAGTISSLGLTPGTYTWTWGSGGNADSLVLTISAPTPAPSAVPSLSEWTQLLLALMTITLVGWHFHRERSY